MPTSTDVIRNLALQAIIDRFIASGTVSMCTMETVADSAIAQCPFSSSAFVSAVAGVSTANAITVASADITGTIDHVGIYDPGAVRQMVCTIGTSGAEFTIGSLDITAGDQITVTSLTFTFPAT